MEKIEDTSKKSKKKIIVTVVVIVAVILATTIALMAINKSKGNKKGGPGGWGGFGGFGGGQTVTSVRTAVAEKMTLNDFVTTSGEIETQSSIEVYPSIGGTVVQVNVSLGSPVKKGDVIAYVDPSEPGVYYAKSPVTAPISGSILTTPVRSGQKVTANSVVTKIGDIDNLQVSAKIPERYISELKIGQKAEVKVEAYPDVVFTASVVRISPVVDAATRTKEIILNFDKKDTRINAGMYANVKLFTSVYSGQIAIQQDALVNNADKYYLYVVNEDGETVSKREVTLGKNVNGYYQILSGVSEGESVVTAGMLTLSDGGKIKDIGKVQASAPAEGMPQMGAPGDMPADMKDMPQGAGKPDGKGKKGGK